MNKTIENQTDARHVVLEHTTSCGVIRPIPTTESSWSRAGDMVRVALIDLEPALPAGVAIGDILDVRVVTHLDGVWTELPYCLDYCDGYERWCDSGKIQGSTRLCFSAPSQGSPSVKPWPGAANSHQRIALMLWDSQSRARLEGVEVYYALQGDEFPAAAPDGDIRLEAGEMGYAVWFGQQRLIHFDATRGYQIDWVCLPGKPNNLVPEGSVWRWVPTETTTELFETQGDQIEFTPLVCTGPMMVVAVSAVTVAGRMSATLRMFFQRQTLVLEFADYRAIRTRSEIELNVTAAIVGRFAHSYPGIHYAIMMVASPLPEAQVMDYRYKYESLESNHPLSYVYGEQTLDWAYKWKGWKWLTLQLGDSVVGLSAHSRTHRPDHPFKCGSEKGQTIIALEPFGMNLDGHYHSCDRYFMAIGPDVAHIQEVYDTLDTNPILVRVPVVQNISVLTTYDCVCKWINLNLDYLLVEGRYRNALRTDGTILHDADTCMVATGELIRLYEKTGWEVFREKAFQAANMMADWISAGRFSTRGDGVGPNNGGIYQNEQIGMLLALARVSHYADDGLQVKLITAIRTGVQWMLDNRGGEGTWGWADYSWQTGAWNAKGEAVYRWPVNTAAFATLNIRLYQLLGDRQYLTHAVEILQEYFKHMSPNSWEINPGGGVSDTTRMVHLLTEALEICTEVEGLDSEFLRACVRGTLERFWLEGHPFVRHSIYGELYHPGEIEGDPFSPGFSHNEDCGSFLDILPRMEIPAEAGVSEHLTRWAMRDFCYDFDARYGFEQHTHHSLYIMRDTDIEPASWLDPELLATIYAVRDQGWLDKADEQIILYKVHRMIQSTFISLDEQHGGWAACYDSYEGKPLRYLAMWEDIHSHERFAPGEPLEMWGVAPREAYHDHSTHYWSPLEQVIDDLVEVKTTGLVDGVQIILCIDLGLGGKCSDFRVVLTPKIKEADTVKVFKLDNTTTYQVDNVRTVDIGQQQFWLLQISM